MTAFFFGPGSEQLFGFYHPPRGSGERAAVICPSWGPEYQYAHRALRVTARRLAERGFHVLRFDYSGTGDSWGDGTDGDVVRWCRDIALAVDELRALSGVPRVDLVGLRLGAFLAAAAAAGRDDVRGLVLWDPVIDGRAWIGELSPNPARRAGGDRVEFAQRLVTTSLVRQFEEVSPASYPSDPAGRVLLLETASGAVRGADALLARFPSADRQRVEDPPAWIEDVSIWSGQVPAKAIGAFTEWLRA